MAEKRDELTCVEELFQFLQGVVPDGYHIAEGSVPKLSPDQAWTAVWYIQEQHRQYLDHIERCDVCGDLYDCDNDGSCLDFGETPYHFCGGCENGPEYDAKLATKTEEDGDD